MVTDIFWALVEDHLIEPSRLVNASVNGISLAAVAAGCFFWYKFVEYRLHSRRMERKSFRITMHGLIVAVIALDLLSILTGWVFFIDENDHYTYGPLFWVQAVGCHVYLLIPTVKSLRRAFQTRSRLQRREYLLYASYMIAPLVAGFTEDWIPTVPVLSLNMFMVIHVLFLSIQDMQIYNDAPTGLNNRRRLDKFLEEHLASASESCPVSVFMLDINRFKEINDTYGHIEGDRVLKAVAEALKLSAARYHAFVARYGGDEFCLVLDKAGTSPEAVAEKLHSTLALTQEQYQTCEVSVSVGWVMCSAPEHDPERVLSQADKRLYEDKVKWHEKNA